MSKEIIDAKNDETVVYKADYKENKSVSFIYCYPRSGQSQYCYCNICK